MKKQSTQVTAVCLYFTMLPITFLVGTLVLVMSCVTGDETGLVKVWDITRASGASLKSSCGEQSRVNAVAALCWQDGCTQAFLSSHANGVLSLYDKKSIVVKGSRNVGCSAVASNALTVVQDKAIMVTQDSRIACFTADEALSNVADAALRGPVQTVHLHRKYRMVAVGGKDNDLCVYDLQRLDSEDVDANKASTLTPIFAAQNVRDHVLDVPYPVHVVGVCVVNPYVFCATTAYHQVRFYDRRTSERPVQEYAISREIERRPTTMLQWNDNKFLIGEASGDVHLYDTRRGFASRAKLRGGVGSVRCMVKHPAGHQILGVTGLDRKARLYHVPTGRLLLSVYTKQRANCMLLDKDAPLKDDMQSYSTIVNAKQPERLNRLGDEVWDDMDPIVDDIVDDDAQHQGDTKKHVLVAAANSKRVKRRRNAD